MRLLWVCLISIFTIANLHGQLFEIYISDAGNFNNPPWQILSFDGDGNNGQKFINTNLAWPQDILFVEERNEVLISNLSSGKIDVYNAESGAYIKAFATGISGPTRMKLGPGNMLYVLQWSGSGRVLRYDLDGNLIDAFTSIGVPNSIGMDWDKAGDLYVSSYNGKVIHRFDSDGNSLGLFVNDNLLGPTNIWFNKSDELVVMDYNDGTVKIFNKDGSFKSIFISGLNQPEGVDFYPNGDFILGDGGTGSIKLFNEEGDFIKNIVEPGTLNLLTPNTVRLREVRSTGVKSTDDLDIKINPSIGREFFVANKSGKNILRLEVYDTGGALVEKNQIDSWNAMAVDTGMYIMKVYLEDNIAKSFKLMVKD